MEYPSMVEDEADISFKGALVSNSSYIDQTKIEVNYDGMVENRVLDSVNCLQTNSSDNYQICYNQDVRTHINIPTTTNLNLNIAFPNQNLSTALLNFEGIPDESNVKVEQNSTPINVSSNISIIPGLTFDNSNDETGKKQDYNIKKEELPVDTKLKHVSPIVSSIISSNNQIQESVGKQKNDIQNDSEDVLEILCENLQENVCGIDNQTQVGVKQLQHYKQQLPHQNSYVEYVKSTSDLDASKPIAINEPGARDIVLERIGKLVDSAKEKADSNGLTDVHVVLQKEDSPDGQVIIVKVVEELGQSVNLANMLDLICLEGFETEANCRDHIKNSCRQQASVHDNSNDPEKDQLSPVICDCCQRFFCTEPLLDIHKSNTHTENESINDIQQDSQQLSYPSKFLISDDPERRFMCELCKKTFKSRKDVYQHGRHVHGGVPRKKQKYDCESCSRFFRTRRALFAHKLLEHNADGGLQCEHCGKKFAFDDKLKRHVDAVHLKIVSHQCNECPRGFHDSYALKVHMERVHYRKGEFGCDHCSQRFNTRKALTHHFEQVHFDQKKFQCDICGGDFEKYQHLVEHVEELHGQEKEFRCKACTLVFPSKPCRNLHMNFRHSTRKRCGYCGRYCKTQAALDTHIAANHEVAKIQKPPVPKRRKVSVKQGTKVSSSTTEKVKSEEVVNTSDNEETTEINGSEITPNNKDESILTTVISVDEEEVEEEIADTTDEEVIKQEKPSANRKTYPSRKRVQVT